MKVTKQTEFNKAYNSLAAQRTNHSYVFLTKRPSKSGGTQGRATLLIGMSRSVCRYSALQAEWLNVYLWWSQSHIPGEFRWPASALPRRGVRSVERGGCKLAFSIIWRLSSMLATSFSIIADGPYGHRTGC